MAQQLAPQFEEFVQAEQVQPSPAQPFDARKVLNPQGPMLGRRMGGYIFNDARGSGRERRFAGLFTRQFNHVARRSIGTQAQHVQNAPKQIISVSCTEAPYISPSDHSVSTVTVQFTRDAHDVNYDHTRIWIQGYQGSSATRLVADAIESPHSFNLESTGETITIICQAIGITGIGATITNSPRTQITLNGQTTAPSAPTISQLTAAVTNGATTLGQQFTFNTVPDSTSQLISGYWVYRSSSSTTPVPPASRLKFYKQPASGTMSIVVSDLTGVSTNYYWVSAVNTAQLESSLAAAGTSGGGGGGGTTTTYRPSTHTIVSGAGFTNPSNVWDGNTSSFASATSSHASGATYEDTWQGWSSAVGSPISIKLKVVSQASVSGSGDAVTIKLRYSLDGGSTYTNVYQTSVSRALTTDTITLPNAQNLTQVKVDMFVSVTPVLNGTNSATGKLYEAWIEVTT